MERGRITRVLGAAVTPLASIFGSGFLIIVPLLERAMGRLAVLGVIIVSAAAWFVGSVIRHNIAVVEEQLERGTAGAWNKRLEYLSDIVIAVAYIVSVGLYLRIMAEYIVRYVSPGNGEAVGLLAGGAMVLIVVVGVIRGFSGLDLMERLALVAVLVITTVLGATFLGADLDRALGEGIELPPPGDESVIATLLILGGTVITVQGFETVRYLGDQYDRPTRIWASRVAQLVAASIYLGFVIVATPLMGAGSEVGADTTLVDITERVAPLLSLPLVLCAVLSQFSAATADTVAAAGHLHEHSHRMFVRSRAYLASGVAAGVLIITVPTFTLVVVASRAFAAYYFLQCVIAMRTTQALAPRIGFGALATVMAAVTLFAKPVG